MSAKVGRNSLCPCGSGIKYKKCHLNRENQEPLTAGENIAIFNNHKIDKKCLHPRASKSECDGKIIQAHTVSKSGSLKRMAENGKVLQFTLDIPSLYKGEKPQHIKPVGINKASTFPGFCKKHDKEMFSPVENGPFEIDEHSSFLLGYRALTREIYAKRLAMGYLHKGRASDKGRSPEKQFRIQNFINDSLDTSELALRDLLANKDKYDSAYFSSSYEESNYYAIKFSEVPHILFSGATQPQYDFVGKELQSMDSIGVLEEITVNAVSTDEGGAVLFQWMGDSEVNLEFVRSLNNTNRNALASTITQFAFESFENLFIRPSWWEAVGDKQDSLIGKSFCGSIKPHTNSCFIPDGGDYFKWQDLQIETNLAL